MITKPSLFIKKCRACYSGGLLKILSLGNVGLSNFSKSNKKPLSFPLELVLCQECQLLQLKHTAPSSALYTDNYGYKSGINKTMRDHLKQLARESLGKLSNKKNKIVCVDIGANDGTLLSFFKKNVFRVGIDPVRKFAKESKKNANLIISDYFSFKSYSQHLGSMKADIITAISCFYDINDLNSFLKDIVKILHKDGIFVVQQNYLISMLDQNGFDNIVHEHLTYFSLSSLQTVLRRHQLEVFDIKLNDLNGGSFRTYICFKNKRKILPSVSNILLQEKGFELNSIKTYKNFAERIQKNRDKFRKFIKKEVGKGKKIYIYGASTRGNTLIEYYKLDKKLIPFAVERNPEKWGKKIASAGIPIISEEQARKEKPDYMLVLPWFFKEEFLKREKKYLKNGGHFIFPLPKLEII